MEENAQQEGNIPMENPAQVEENTHHKKPACTENSASAAPAAAAGPHEGGSAPSPRAPLETTRAPKAAPPFDPSQPPMLPMAMMGKGMLIGKAKGAPLGIGGKGALPPVASVPARSFDDEMPMGKGGSPCREPMHDGREARSRSRNRDERRVEIPISKSSPRSINDKGSSAFMPMQRMGQNTLAPRPVGKRPPMIPMQRIVPTSNMMPNSKGKGGSFDPRRPPLMQSNLTSMMPRPPGMGMGMPGARTMPSRPAAPRPMMGGGKMGGKGAGMMQGAKGNAMFNNGMGQPQNPLGMVTPRSMPIGTSGVHAYNVAVSKAKPAVAAKLTKEEGLEHRRQRATPTGPILPLPGTVIARLPPMTRDRLLADDIEEAARTFCISLQLSVPDAVRQVSPMVFYLDFPSVDTAKLFKEKASDELTVNNYTLTLTFTASRDNLEVTNSLMVRNLQNLTEADVLKAFRALGCPPKSCRIMMDKEPPYKSKGFGFLAYSEPSEAAQALNRLRSVHWKICNNVQISASFARNRFVPSDAKRKNDDSFGKEHLEEQLRMHKNKDPDEEIGEKAKQALAGVNGSMWSNYLDLFKKRKRVTGNWQEVEEYLFSAFEDDETDGMFYDIKSRFFFKGESFYNYFAEEKVCVEIDADGNQKEVPDMVECHKLPPGYVAPGEDPPEPEPVPEPVAEAQPNTNPPDAEPDAKRQRYDPMSQVQPPNVLDAPPEMPRPPPLPECLASMFPNPSDTPPTLPGNVPILPLPPLPPFGSLPGLAMPLPPLPPPGMLLPPPGTLPPPNSGTLPPPSSGTLPPPSSSTLPPPNSGTLLPPTFGTLPPPNFGTLPPPNFGTLPPPNSLPPASGKESLGAPTAPPNVEAAPERPLPVDAQSPPPPHRDSGPVRPSLPSQPVAEPSQAPPAPSNPPPAAAQPSPVCDLCQRKFMNEEALQRHVLLSELHKTNLIKQQQQQAGRH